MDICICIFLLIFLCSIKRTTSPYELSVHHTTSIKGMCAIAVMLGHISQIVGGSVIKNVYWDIQLLGMPVPIFFFLSGYGMSCSLQKGAKEKFYWRNFWVKKISSLVIPLFVSALLYFISIQIIMHQNYTAEAFIQCAQNSFKGILHGVPITLNAWYVYLLILFCIFFWWAFHSCSIDNITEKAIFKFILLLSIEISLCILIMLFVLHWGGWWSKSCYAFPIGVMWSFWGSRIKGLIEKNWKKILMLSMLIYVQPLMLEKYTSGFISKTAVVFYPISAVCVVFFMIIFIKFFKLDSAIFSFIGKYSFEVYLLHGLVYTILAEQVWLIHRGFLFTLSTIILSIIGAILMHSFFVKIGNSIKRKYIE